MEHRDLSGAKQNLPPVPEAAFPLRKPALQNILHPVWSGCYQAIFQIPHIAVCPADALLFQLPQHRVLKFQTFYRAPVLF